MEQENELRGLHNSWLNHPITKAAFRAIERHRNNFIQQLESDVTKTTVDVEYIRLNAMGLKTCSAVLTILQDKSNFQLTSNELNNL